MRKILSSKLQNSILPASIRHQQQNAKNQALSNIALQPAQNGVCISTFGISIFLAMGVAGVAMMIILSAYFLRPSHHKY